MKAGTGLKIFLTIVFFCILFYKIDLNSILFILQSLNIMFLMCALAFVPVLYLLRTARWSCYLEALGISLPFYQILEILLMGIFYGLITPGKIGEFGRAFHINEKKSVTIPTIIMEKMFDIGVLLILSIVTVFCFFLDSAIIVFSIFLISLGVMTVILLSVNERFMKCIGGIFGIIPGDIGNFIATLKLLMGNYPVMLKSIVITFSYYLIAYCIAFFIVMAADMNLNGIYILPIIVLMGNVPVTISGLGLRESIGSLCFVLMDEPAADGFVFSMLIFILITVLPAVCGYLITITRGIHDIV